MGNLGDEHVPKMVMEREQSLENNNGFALKCVCILQDGVNASKKLRDTIELVQVVIAGLKDLRAGKELGASCGAVDDRIANINILASEVSSLIYSSFL